MNTVDLVGYFAGICLALSFLPQVWKTWRTKSAADVSWGLLWLTLGAALGYEYYAWALDLLPVVIMNGIFTVLVLAEMALKLRFDHEARTPA